MNDLNNINISNITKKKQSIDFENSDFINHKKKKSDLNLSKFSNKISNK